MSLFFFLTCRLTLLREQVKIQLSLHISIPIVPHIAVCSIRKNHGKQKSKNNEDALDSVS